MCKAGTGSILVASPARSGNYPVTESSVTLPPEPRRSIMFRPQSDPPLCPMCHKTMRLMLEKGTGWRKLRCLGCGQPDPMQSADTQRWIAGELKAPL